MSEETTTSLETEESAGCCSGSGCDHQHGPSGADIVKGLSSGFAVLSLVTPLFLLICLGIGLLKTPSSALILVSGIVIALLHLALSTASAKMIASRELQWGLSPWPVIIRAGIEELSRAGIIWLSFYLFAMPFTQTLAAGLWIGLMSATVWALAATAQFVTAAKRMRSPSDYSKSLVAAVMQQHVTPNKLLRIRFLDLVGLMAFQVGASILIAASPVMVLATLVFAVATALSRLIVSARKPATRLSTSWVWAPFGLGLATFVISLFPLLAS